MKVEIKNLEQEFLDSIKHLPENDQELCKAVRQETLKTVYGIQAEMVEEKKEIDSRIAELKSQYEGNATALKQMEEILAKHGTTLTGIKAGATKQDYLNGRDAIKDAVEQYKANLDSIRANKSGETPEFVVKTDYLRSSVTSSTQAQRLGTYALMGYGITSIYNLFPKVQVSPESNGVIRYIDQTTATRNAAWKAEGTQLPESAIAWTEYSLTLQKIGDTIPVSEEVLQDTARLAAELDKFLALNVDLKVDSDLAVGTGVAPIISGVTTLSSTYTATAANIVDASIYDLVVKMKESITSAYGGKYRPNFILMNITDINRLKLKKDKNYNYVVAPFSNGIMEIDGMMVVENNNIVANTCVVGDSRFGTIYEVEGYTASVGYSGSQFSYDMMTMKARRRLALLIRQADRTGFAYCSDIDAAIATIGGVAGV